MNLMRQQAALQQTGRATTRIGVVSSYDPTHYCAKVRLQPEDIETGWLPVASLQVGNGWGLFCPPSAGDMVQVEFQEADGLVGVIVGRFFNDADRPLGAPSGEFWLVNKSGSKLRFHNDGTVDLVAVGTLTTSAPQWNHTGPVHITGNLQLTGDAAVSGNETVGGNVQASGNVGDHAGSMDAMRSIYNSHTNGAGTTTPTPPM